MLLHSYAVLLSGPLLKKHRQRTLPPTRIQHEEFVTPANWCRLCHWSQEGTVSIQFRLKLAETVISLHFPALL